MAIELSIIDMEIVMKKTKHELYSMWSSMKARCFNKNTVEYHRYGGRGITVCERWLKFENFLEDMGERPYNTQIDRIDNDGNYEPGNCRWVTPKENCNNKSLVLLMPKQLRCGCFYYKGKIILFCNECIRKEELAADISRKILSNLKINIAKKYDIYRSL